MILELKLNFPHPMALNLAQKQDKIPVKFAIKL